MKKQENKYNKKKMISNLHQTSNYKYFIYLVNYLQNIEFLSVAIL